MSGDIELSPDRWEREFALKQADLHLRERQGGLWHSPVFLGLIAAALALFGNMYATWSQSKSAAQQAHVKAQSDLVLEAIKTSDPKLAAKNLLFLVHLGLLDDPDGKMQVVLSQPDNVPYLPAQGVNGATALCLDGTYSFSRDISTACSHHGGVAKWL